MIKFFTIIILFPLIFSCTNNQYESLKEALYNNRNQQKEIFSKRTDLSFELLDEYSILKEEYNILYPQKEMIFLQFSMEETEKEYPNKSKTLKQQYKKVQELLKTLEDQEKN